MGGSMEDLKKSKVNLDDLIQRSEIYAIPSDQVNEAPITTSIDRGGTIGISSVFSDTSRLEELNIDLGLKQIRNLIMENHEVVMKRIDKLEKKIMWSYPELPE